jgi:hypothetical protein
MTERIDDHNDIDSDDWHGADDDDLLDFSVDEFDADMIAAANLMPVETPSDDDQHITDDFDVLTDDYEDFSAWRDDERRPRTRKPHPHTLHLSTQQRHALRSELARVFGKRHAERATKGFLSEISRLGRMGRSSDPHQKAQAMIVAATQRLARRTSGLDKSATRKLAANITAAILPPDDEAEDTHALGSTAAELRMAKDALRQAARYLLRVERRISERDAGRG